MILNHGSDYDKHLEAKADKHFKTDYYICKCGCEFDEPFKHIECDDKWLGCPECGSTDFNK